MALKANSSPVIFTYIIRIVYLSLAALTSLLYTFGFPPYDATFQGDFFPHFKLL